jgi:hypothetical protein
MTGHSENMTALSVPPVHLWGIVRHNKAGQLLPKGKAMTQIHRCKECGYMIAPVRPNRVELVCSNDNCSLVSLPVYIVKGDK